MTYLWISIILLAAAAVAIAIEWANFRRFIGPRWVWWNDQPKVAEEVEFDQRCDAHRRLIDCDLLVQATDHIEEPDDRLERLIATEQLCEAMEYRLEMSSMARERQDHEMLRKYAIYGARIAAAQMEIEARKRSLLHEVVEERREQEAIEKDKQALQLRTQSEPVSTEDWRMPAVGKPPKPPLWSPKLPEPERPRPEPSTPSPALQSAESADTSAAPASKSKFKRFLEFPYVSRFRRPPLKTKPDEEGES